MKSDLFGEFRKFKELNPIFIGGLEQLRTILTVRLLDGHPKPLIYPIENHMMKDFFCADKNRLPCKVVEEVMRGCDQKIIFRLLMQNDQLQTIPRRRIATDENGVSDKNLKMMGPS